MAAPSQRSPNQASKAQEEVMPDSASQKPAPSDDSVVLEDAQVRETELSYESTEASHAYSFAKSLMQVGEFDQAMETIGIAMGEITNQLTSQINNVDDAAVHPALAPLYYLYGTTLLYTIEESSDAIPTTTSDVPIEDNNNNYDNDHDEDNADDTQIAWENLESARMIVHRMLADGQIGMHTNIQDKLKLDLAQIHLRLGDLQRANGRYQESLTDYTSSLELRLPLLGPYDRKVADTHYNLGLVCMLLAAQGDCHQQSTAKDSIHGEDAVDNPIILPSQVMEEYRAKALAHYLNAAKSFAGQIAILAGCMPEDVLAQSTQQPLSGKTTGMNEDELNAIAMSATLTSIRAGVAPLGGSGNSEVDATIHDMKEILDEIQETVDEAESAKMAMAEVSQLKKQAQTAAEGNGEVLNLDGSITTIGFGPSSANIAPTSAGSVASHASGTRPMMVVRKKKPASDSTMPAATGNEPDTKRFKADLD